MQKKLLLLDSAAVLNNPNFSFSDGSYAMPYRVADELKDLQSRNLLQNALHSKRIALFEPSHDSLKAAKELAESRGVIGLSATDLDLIAVAIDLCSKQLLESVQTDDYSVQNMLLLLKIPFKAVLHKGITEERGFQRKCIGCGKTFNSSFVGRTCPDCGSFLKKEKK